MYKFICILILAVSLSSCHKPAVVDYNEKEALSNLVSAIDQSNGKYTSFSIRYSGVNYIGDSKDFTINLDYGDFEYEKTFHTFDEFIKFIADPSLYNEKILDTSKR
jgi:hypothetical protein